MLDHFPNRRIGLFVGAGSSFALAGLPLQGTFIREFLDWVDQGDSDHPRLSPDLQRLLEAIGDIELVTSHMHNVAFAAPGRRDRDNVRALMFLRVALASFIDARTDPELTAGAQLVEEFLKPIAPSLFIVTTNYDLVLEDTLGRVLGPDSFWYPHLACDRNRPHGGIPILKLHGSVNWMEDRGLADCKDFSRTSGGLVLRKPSNLQLRPSKWDRWGLFFEGDGKKFTPVVVPFLFQKSAWLSENNENWRDIFEPAWRCAGELIATSEALHFWGYGLPVADYHMFSFLFDSLDRFTGTCRIVDKLSDPSKPTTLIKLARLLMDERAEVSTEGLLAYLRESRERVGA